MRYLGIDYGTKYIGLALSDEGGQFAFPSNTILNNKKIVAQISELCKKEEVSGIVIGESKNYAQKENPIMKDISVLKEKIEQNTSLPVFLEPEFLTSRQAQRMNTTKDAVNASAAALILQSYLDRKNSIEDNT